MTNIRKVADSELRVTEEITRNAFWNKYIMGCTEHFLLHNLRKCDEYIPELDLVLEKDDEIISSVIYTKSFVELDNGESIETLTFGPFSTKNEYQNLGYGKALLDYSIEKSKELGYKAIIIFGNPEYYKKYGFLSCFSYKISFAGTYPKAMLVLELEENYFKNKKGKYKYSETFYIAENEELLEAFDKTFEYKEKEETLSQKEFIELASQFDSE